MILRLYGFKSQRGTFRGGTHLCGFKKLFWKVIFAKKRPKNLCYTTKKRAKTH